MTERIDHAAEALKALGQIRGVDEATNQVTLAIEAQVHATLALVEQQRIANLIAYFADKDVIDMNTLAGEHAAIREGLGL